MRLASCKIMAVLFGFDCKFLAGKQKKGSRSRDFPKIKPKTPLTPPGQVRMLEASKQGTAW